MIAVPSLRTEYPLAIRDKIERLWKMCAFRAPFGSVFQPVFGGGEAITVTTFTLTCTTTGAQTLTLQSLGVATGKTVTVSWGDGNSNDYTGDATRTHAYAGAGVWTVTMSLAIDIVKLDLRDAKLSGIINANNPMPTGLTYLLFGALTNLTWTVGVSAPMPIGLTYLYLNSLANLNWTVGVSASMPSSLLNLIISSANNVTMNTWSGNNVIRTIQWESSLSQAAVDGILTAIWNNKANFTYATPSLDLLGGSNAAPSGIYQSICPPTTGKEYKYDLVNGICTPAGPEWTVQTA